MAALITKDELLKTNPVIEKKFLLINSSLYEDDAYQYLLDLVTASGSIAFITDERKIWTQGQYFGGDAFLDKMQFWKTIRKISDSGEELQSFTAWKSAETLTIKDSHGLNVNLIEDAMHQDTMEFNLDLDAIVNTEKFTIEQNATYNLEVDDNKQIHIKKYVPCSVSVSTTIFEYDSGDHNAVKYTMNIYGTDPLTAVTVTADNNVEALYDNTTNIITADIPENTNVKFTILYTDGTTTGTYTFTQKYGYGIWYDVYAPEGEDLTYDADDILTGNIWKNKYLATAYANKTITLNQADGEYGWFICPSDWKIAFTDTSTNLQGGWEKSNTVRLYNVNIKYQIWKTEHPGLGNVKWNITSK